MKIPAQLTDLGEDAVVARLLQGFSRAGLAVGPGDDCAVVDEGGDVLRLLKTDAIIQGIHFLREAAPEKVGWKAVARVVSDFAAMGGEPRFLLVTLALSGSMELTWVEKLYAGMRHCMEHYGAVLAGGETCRVPEGAPMMISVAGEGAVRRESCVTRSGGHPGDVLAVTGALGRSIQGRHLSFHPRVDEGRSLGRAGVSAMMDLSDGLARDLPRLARASGCGFRIEETVLPRHREASVEQALNDGEDYELLFAAPPQVWRKLRQEWPEGLAPLTAIGELTETGGMLEGGWDHFQSD